MWQPAQIGAQNSNLLGLLNQSNSNVGANNPYSTYTPDFLSVFNSLFSNPGTAGFQSAAGTSGAQSTATGAQDTAASGAINTGALSLLPGAQSVMNMGLDPQSVLYNQLYQQNADQSNVRNAQYGLTGQQAAGNANQSATNFNIDWQNQQLTRAIQALGAGGNAVTQAGTGATTAANLGQAGAADTLMGGTTPYNTAGTIAGNQSNALTSLMQALLGPTTSSQSTINNLMQYLGLGASQSDAQAQQELANYQAQLSGTEAGGGIGAALGNLFGGSSSAAGPFDAVAFASGLPWSDRRLKRDIVKVGMSLAGLPVYVFKYLWDDMLRVGVMADEAETLFPDAVVLHPSGFKQVNYALLG